ncbi:MAG TPA: nuclear transport factor 2 family protein [Acidobacteriota bacterium]|nr:nuclear transport factor 2 family protein [Acidobacteriota bacterium]
MKTADPTAVALAFVERINTHDVDKLCALMTDDHRFVDALDGEGNGREHMRTGWAMYLSWFPDYSVTVERTLADGDFVMLVGRARATFAVKGELRPENAWDIPAAWTGLIRDGLVAEWRVYCDNEPARVIMKRNGVTI